MIFATRGAQLEPNWSLGRRHRRAGEPS